MPTTTIKTVTTTEIDVENLSDVVDVLLSDDNVTAEAVRAIQERLEKIVMPWAPDGSQPPAYVRRTGTGKEVGRVTANLGGFTWAHYPWQHGWGYRASVPNKSGTLYGIETVDLVGVDPSTSDPNSITLLKASAEEARARAMDRVDEWLEREYPFHTVLRGSEGE